MAINEGACIWGGASKCTPPPNLVQCVKMAMQCTLSSLRIGSLAPSHLRLISRLYSQGLPWEKTPYRAAKVDLSKIPQEEWTSQLRQDFPRLLKGEEYNNEHLWYW